MVIKSRLERARAREGADESGSLILDILIGMAIFALIAIVAVSAVGQYRVRAYKQAAASDATAVGSALEAAFIDDSTYPDDTDPTLAAALAPGGALEDVTLTKGNRIVGYEVMPDGESFLVCVEHATNGVPNAFALYDSANGGLAETGRGEGCSAITTPAEPVPDPDENSATYTTVTAMDALMDGLRADSAARNKPYSAYTIDDANAILSDLGIAEDIAASGLSITLDAIYAHGEDPNPTFVIMGQRDANRQYPAGFLSQVGLWSGDVGMPPAVRMDLDRPGTEGEEKTNFFLMLFAWDEPILGSYRGADYGSAFFQPGLSAEEIQLSLPGNFMSPTVTGPVGGPFEFSTEINAGHRATATVSLVDGKWYASNMRWTP